MGTKKEQLLNRDGLQQSPWQSAVGQKIGNVPNPATLYDCLVIGGGMTGLTAALLLQNAGRKVCIAEASNIGFGTTGGTSAHINTFADTTYREAESAFGKDGAKLFAEAVNEGLGLIKANIGHYRIDCDFETRTGFLYAETEKEAEQLDDIFEGSKAVGVQVNYTVKVPTPVGFQAALEFEGQAQFHPIKYIRSLAAQFLAAGGRILEHTLIDSLRGENDLHIGTAGDLELRAKKVIYATHIPPGINSYSLRCAPYRSYVLAVKLRTENYPEALVYDMQEPYHYFRTHVIDGQKLLIAGGHDHKTGHDDPEKAFEDLEKYIRKYYEVSSVKYRWSSQYYVPVDGLPYIGQMPEAAEGVFCATGYNGNGMMLGSIAGKILADLVQGKASKYEQLFCPSRLKPVAGFSAFIQENADVAYHFVADRFRVQETDSLKRLHPGTGKVVEVAGKKIAAYRDEAGVIHALSPICTHAACVVNWNAEERSWDCPCHGARYDIDGQVLTGPATKGLAKIVNDES
jgi:glycine/D-amino acid oxidase-like deaminating enzyme/nitrite reductase/ring-hydroxylating ferredoxin subunit